MINKRGLTPAEFDELEPELFEYLMIYDAYIEPSGTRIDMLFHAHQCYTMTLNNPNITDSLRKSLRVDDFDFLDILNANNLSFNEKQEKRKKDKEEKQANDIKALGEQMKKMALGKNNNGKK
ncbi:MULTISPECIES: hypothetical protein [unclassified Enterobacter]|uniref:hypothetical protein n=1 Tax=unclassified Enterobacter TaxID=2608935 RepID=UPI0021A27305|nr:MULTISPECIES: hypothetical protein [unclassified Enterobacter]